MIPAARKRVCDPRPQVPSHFELLAGKRPGDETHHEMVHVHAFETHDRRGVQKQRTKLGIGEGFVAYRMEDRVHLVHVRGRGHGHVDNSPGPVTRQVRDLDDLPVRDEDDFAVHRAKARDPKRDVLDGAEYARRCAECRDADRVTEPVLPLRDDEEAREDVLDDALCAEPDRDSCNGRRCDEARDRDTEPLDDEDPHHRVDENEQGPRDDLGDGVAVLRSLRSHELVAALGAGVDLADVPVADPGDEPGEENRPGDDEH